MLAAGRLMNSQLPLSSLAQSTVSMILFKSLKPHKHESTVRADAIVRHTKRCRAVFYRRLDIVRSSGAFDFFMAVFSCI